MPRPLVPSVRRAQRKCAIDLGTRPALPRAARASAEALERRLLCARNIIVAAGGTATLAQVDQFSDSPGTDLTISPATINAAAGNVTLRANNDVIFQNGVDISAAGVDLTVQAGRSVRLEPDLLVRTNSGAISFTANEGTAAGVVNAQRQVGAAVVEMELGQTQVDAGNANITLRVGQGTGLTNSASGDITTAVLRTFGLVILANAGPTAGSDILSINASPIVRAGGVTLDVTGAGGGGAIGTLGRPITVSPRVVGPGAVINVEAQGQSGGVFVDTSSGALAVGGAAAGRPPGIATSGGGAVRVRSLGPAASALVNVTEAVGASGDCTLESTGGLTAGAGINSATGAVTLRAGADIDLSTIASDVTTANTATLTADSDGSGSGAILSVAGALVTCGHLAASAATGIDLDTRASTLAATTTAAGAIEIDETDAVTLSNVQTANGRITINTGGNTLVTRVASVTDGNANDILITAATGNLTVTTVDAGAAAGDVLLRATAGSVFDDGNEATLVRCDILTLRAAGDVGALPTLSRLDTTVNSVDAQSTTGLGAGDHGIFLRETDAVTLTAVTTADGSVVVTSGAAMTVQTVTAGGAGRVVFLTSGAGMTVGNVSAANATLDADGGPLLDDNNNATRITAARLRLDAVRTIGMAPSGLGTEQVDVDADALIAFTSAAAAGLPPGIFIADVDGVVIEEMESAAGPIHVVAGGPLETHAVFAAPGGGGISLTASSGDLTAGGVAGAGGTVNLNAPAGSVISRGTTGRVSAATLNISVLNGVGEMMPVPNPTLPLRTDAGVINLVGTTTAFAPGGRPFEARIDELDAVTLQSVQVARCVVHVTAGGGITATDLRSNSGGFILTAAGGLALGRVDAPTGGALLTAAGAISDANGPDLNVITRNATLSGTAVGAAADPIETQFTALGGLATAGGFWIDNRALLQIDILIGLPVEGLRAAGDIQVTSTNSILVRGVNVETTAAGNILLRVPDGGAGTSESANIRGNVRAVNGSVRIEAADAIQLFGGSVQASADAQLALVPAGAGSAGLIDIGFNSQVTGGRVELIGGPGDDEITVSPAFVTQPIHVSGMRGADELRFSASGNTNRVVHVTPDSIGAAAGDNFFGAGGSVLYDDVDLVLNLSSGADSVFVAPGFASVTVNGGDPVAGGAGVDRLTVATANMSFDFTPTSTDSGQFTFLERGDIIYDEFEQTSTDGSAPAIVSSRFHFESGPHRVTFRFSDDVSASLTPSDLVLENGTTNTRVPESSIALAYDATTNTATFTFPGFAGGVLPNGDYRAILHAPSVRDFAGNSLAGTVVLNFFFLAGDINRDRFVNGTDFALLASNFGRPGTTYAQGDLNGDGSVNGTDFALLAGNFGRSVPVPPPNLAAKAAAVARPAVAAPVAAPSAARRLPTRRTAGNAPTALLQKAARRRRPEPARRG